MRRAVIIAIPVMVALLLLADGVISYMIANAVSKSERKPQEDSPAAYGLPYEEVEFPSRDDQVSLSGWYVPGDSERPTIIMVHGIDSVRSGANAVNLASRLAPYGFNILMFDLRGHGSSEGSRVSGGLFELQDVLGAFDYLRSRGSPAGSIGLIGFSMGGGASLLAAAAEPAIRAVVIDSPYARASELLAQETALRTPLPRWLTPVFIPTASVMANLFYGIDIGKLAPEEAVKQLDYPVLVIHGEADQRVPWKQGQRVYQAAAKGSEFWLVPASDHLDAFIDHPVEYVSRVAAYFDRRLSGIKARAPAESYRPVAAPTSRDEMEEG